MSAPTSALATAYRGRPFVRVRAPNYDTRELGAAYQARPWLGEPLAHRASTLGQALEATALHALDRAKTSILEQALEATALHAVHRAKTSTLGQALEATAALAVHRAKTSTLGQALEASRAFGILSARWRPDAVIVISVREAPIVAAVAPSPEVVATVAPGPEVVATVAPSTEIVVTMT